MLYYEKKFRKRGYNLVIGVDEAGRGPLAGPVVAAAVALESRRFLNRIDDSKKLTASARERAFREIIRKSVFGIGVVGEKAIDRLNILRATRLAMQKAIGRLINKLGPSCPRRVYVLVDGKISLDIALPYACIIRGDAKSKSIASASILAKVTRDRLMDAYEKIYPQYGFIRHKGYPTKEHRDILKRIGPCLIHRKSFSYA